MTVIGSLLTVALLLVAGRSVAAHDSDEATEESKRNPYRLPGQVAPLHYDVKLTMLHMVNGNLSSNGEMNVDVRVRELTDTIALHIRNIMMNETWTKLVRKDEEGNPPDAQVHVPEQHRYDKKTQILRVRFARQLEPAIYTLHLRFTTIADKIHGFYKASYTREDGNKVWLAMTHFQPMSARQAFPCWDEPAIKATFRFSIKHHPNYTALSNMPVARRTQVDEKDGKVWTHFETTPLMSTNILGFVVTDYDHVSNLDGTVRIWAPKQLLRYAPSRLEIAEKAMRQLEEYTNSTVHVPKMDHVTAPQYSSRATENWGMIVYKDTVLLTDDKKRSSFLKLHDVMTITHELAHQWFGNLVSPAWWQYLWLSEGMSTYLKFLITDKFLKEWRIMDFFVVDFQYMLMIDTGSKPININVTSHQDVREAYNFNTYTKSSIMLHMMANILTQDVFRNGLIRYLRAHEYGVVTPDDLWQALQNAVDESNVPHGEFKVKEVMDTWFEQAGYPLVTIERDYATGEIKATQKKFRYLKSNNTENNEAWWIPINFATQTKLDFSSTLPTHWLKPHDESLTIEGEVNVNDWIIINKQLTGYYRVNYDRTNWKRIAIFLNSDDYEKIALLNRVQIINDAYYMVASKRLDIVTYLEIVNYLWREVDSIVWYLVFEIINELNDFVRASADFQRYIFNLMRKLREHVGLDDRPEDDPLTENIRSKLLVYACTYGDAECRAKTTAKLLAYVQDPQTNNIPYDSRFSTACFALMTANESVWNQLRQVFNRTDDNFIGCSINPDILEKQLNSANSYYDLFFHMLREPTNTDRAIDLFIKHSDKISNVTTNEEYEDLFQLFVTYSNNENQLRKVRTYAEQHGVNLNNTLTQKEETIAKIESVVSEIRSALEKNQFSVPLHLDDNTSSA